MKLFLALLCVAVGAAGKDSVTPVPKSVKVRSAWVRHFPNASLGIFPDNLGHITAVGNDTNGGVALLLNTRGRTVAKVPVPIPGITAAAADSSGRVFVIGAEHRSTTIHCIAFAPMFSDVLWWEPRDLSNNFSRPGSYATLGILTPSEDGGAFVLGNWSNGIFTHEFNGGNPGLNRIWASFFSPSRFAVMIARAPSGDIFFVANTIAGSSWPYVTIFKYSPDNEGLATFGISYPGLGELALATAATCDEQGNLVVAGRHSVDTRSSYGVGRCFTMKFDSDLNIQWRRFHGPIDQGRGTWPQNIARAVAVDHSNNIVTTTDVTGTVKYAPDGTVIWEATESGDAMQLDHHGNVFFTQQVGREDGFYESEITKLNSTGTRRWQIRFHDGAGGDNWPAGFVLSEEGDVYFASQNGQDTTIVRFVERGRTGEGTDTAAGNR